MGACHLRASPTVCLHASSAAVAEQSATGFVDGEARKREKEERKEKGEGRRKKEEGRRKGLVA
ncbi:hypothetical protein Dimus_037067, partial [Dionaea muscipula]